MLTFELSSDVLEIPNDAYTTLSPKLIGCSTFGQEYCRLIGWYWRIMRRQLRTLTCARLTHTQLMEVYFYEYRQVNLGVCEHCQLVIFYRSPMIKNSHAGNFHHPMRIDTAVINMRKTTKKYTTSNCIKSRKVHWKYDSYWLVWHWLISIIKMPSPCS